MNLLKIYLSVYWFVTLPGSVISLNILILGGDGMIGSATVNLFLQANKRELSYNLTLLNRGNWYWDTEETIKPFVHHFQCTRGDGFRDTCQHLYNEVVYDVIVDFSCYHPLDMEDILIALHGRFKKYIYISTDSVYEVSRQKLHNGYSREEDAIRQSDVGLQNELNKLDSYGHHKLEGEETLKKYHKMLKYDYIVLRLPDVIGPRDNTIRFWKCLMWAKLIRIHSPILIPDRLVDKPLSFVYSLDVGRLIYQLITKPRPGVFNEVYNLAFAETITLKSLFESISSHFKNSSLQFGNGPFKIGIPSVTRGPIDISKAVKMLKWTPTNLREAIKETFKFYNDAQFNPEYKYILERILDYFGIQGGKYRDFVLMHQKEASERQQKEEL